MASNKSDIELILKARDESASKTVQDLADATTELAKNQEAADKSFADSETKLRKLREVMDDLVRVERDLVAKGRLVQRFKDQGKATTEADVKARKLIATARELRGQLNNLDSGDTGRAKLAGQFDRASVAAQKAAGSFRKQRTSLRALRADMDAAGISTRNLAAAEGSMVGIARKVAAAQGQTATALARVQTGAGGAGAAMRAFAKDSRSSLSITQRLRGEMLSLAAASVGLFGVGREVGKTFDAARQKEAIESRFRVAFDGDPQAVQRELEFLEKTSDRLKISFLTLGGSYSKFISAIPAGVFTLEQQRKIFSDIAIAGRVMRLSQDELEGTFRAIIQIASKGSFQMEELRGQLGDRLPGAVLLMAKSLKVSTRELNKMIEQGEVGADKLVGFGEQFAQKFGGDIEKALAASTSQLDAWLLEIEKLRIEVGEDSGFIDTLGDALNGLTEEIKKPAFKEGLTSIAKVMGQLAQAGVWVVQNFGAVKNVVIALAATKVLGALVRGFFAAKKAAAGLALGLRALSVAGFALSGPGGWLIGAVTLLASLAFSANKARPSIAALREELAKLNDVKFLEDLDSDSIDQQLESIANAIERAQADADKVGGLAKQQTAGSFNERQLLRSFNQELDRVEVLVAAYNKLATERSKRLDRSQDTATPETPAIAGLSEAELDKLDDSLAKANKKIAELNATTLADKLDLIASKYATTLSKINRSIEAAATLGDAGQLADLNGQLAKVQGALAAEQGVIRLTFRKQTLRKLEQLETAALRRGENQLESRLSAIRANYAKTIADLEALGDVGSKIKAEDLLAENIEGELKAVRESLGRELLQLRADDAADLDARLALIEEKYRATINTLKAEGDSAGAALAESLLRAQVSSARKEGAGGQLGKAEEDINKLLELRTAIISRINAEQETGFLSQQEARDKIRAEVQSIDPQINTLIGKAQALSSALSAQGLLSEEDARLFVENLKTMELGLQNLGDEAQVQANRVREEFAGGMGELFTDLVQGTEDAGDVLSEFFSDYLNFIAEAIVQETVLREVQKSGSFADRVFSGVGGLIAGDGLSGFAEKDKQTGAGLATAAGGAVAADGLGGGTAAVQTAAATELTASAAVLTTSATTLSGASTGLTSTVTLFSGVATALQTAAGQLVLAAQQLVGAAASLAAGSSTDAATGVLAAVAHTGGVVGSAGLATRTVSPGIFSSAYRYHSGGIAGLRPREQAAILEVGEEVLPEDDPRHIKNAGQGGQTAAERPVQVHNYLNVDDAMTAMAATPSFKRAVLNEVRLNPGAFKSMIG